jgi:hypothetical protein
VSAHPVGDQNSNPNPLGQGVVLCRLSKRWQAQFLRPDVDGRSVAAAPWPLAEGHTRPLVRLVTRARQPEMTQTM